MGSDAGDLSGAERTGGSSPQALPAAGFVLLAGLTLFWGLNWPFMKIALGEIPVWIFRTLCLWVGGCGLLLLARLGGQRILLRPAEIAPVALCSVFNIVGWHLFSGYGLTLMEAGRASIIAFTMPVWASVLAVPVLGEAFTARKALGLALGMASLVLLIGPDLAVLESAPLGALCMLGAALTWATGTVLFKRFRWHSSTSSLVGWQLIAGALPITAGMLIMNEPFEIAAVSPLAWGSTLYVLAFPMLFCQWAYFRTVRMFPASLAAIGTLAIPILGVFSGALVLGEAVGWREALSLLAVCSALAVVLVRPNAAPLVRDS